MDMNGVLSQVDRYCAEGNLAAAELLLRACLEKANGLGLRGAALTLYNELEGLCRTTGRAEEAAGLSERALALIGRMGLEGTVPHATTLLNAATANRAAGHLDTALEMYQEAAELYRKLGQEDSYQMAALHNNISQLYQERGRHEEALASLEKALAIVLALGGGEAEAATTRVNMALSLLALDRLEEAEGRLREAAAWYGSPQGEKDPHRGSALSAAGELAFRQGRREEAAALLERALAATLEHFGENDACRVIRENLAAVRKG